MNKETLSEAVLKRIGGKRFLEALDSVIEYAKDGYPPILIASHFSEIIKHVRRELESLSPFASSTHACKFSQLAEELEINCKREDFIRGEDHSSSLSSTSHQTDFSIIMPTYNRYPIFIHSIYSACIQIAVKFEVVIVDDGSSDATAEFLGHLANFLPYLHFIKSNTNIGAAEARNLGVEIASGKILSFLDSDNIWRFDFLISARNLALRVPHMYRRYIDSKIRGDGSIVTAESKGQLFNYEELSRRNFVDLNTYLIHRSYFYRSGRFRSELKRRQDWEFVLRSSWAYPPIFEDSKPRVFYRRCIEWGQITNLQRNEQESSAIIARTISDLYESSGSKACIQNVCIATRPLQLGTISISSIAPSSAESSLHLAASNSNKIVLTDYTDASSREVVNLMSQFGLGRIREIRSPMKSSQQSCLEQRHYAIRHDNELPIYPISSAIFRSAKYDIGNNPLLVTTSSLDKKHSLQLKDFDFSRQETLTSDVVRQLIEGGNFNHDHLESCLGIVLGSDQMSSLTQWTERDGGELALAKSLIVNEDLNYIAVAMAKRIPIFFFSPMQQQWLMPVCGLLVDPSTLRFRQIQKVTECNFRFACRHFSEEASLTRLSQDL